MKSGKGFIIGGASLAIVSLVVTIIGIVEHIRLSQHYEILSPNYPGIILCSAGLIGGIVLIVAGVRKKNSRAANYKRW